MMGSVRLKSKSAAFSISAAKEGGAMASEVAANMERDFRVLEEGTRDRSSWGFEIENLSVGSEFWIWRMGILGVGEGELVETGIKHLEEAIIMLAMATSFVNCDVFSLCLRMDN